jgi:hypothetical protein
MASVTTKERAQHYLDRIKESSNPKTELASILSEINNLIFSKSKIPLSKVDKLEIIDELEKRIKISPLLESFNESRDFIHIEYIENINSYIHIDSGSTFSDFQSGESQDFIRDKIKPKPTASDNSDILDVISAMKKKVD